ncbi:transposase [Streptomyces tendae]
MRDVSGRGHIRVAGGRASGRTRSLVAEPTAAVGFFEHTSHRGAQHASSHDGPAVIDAIAFKFQTGIQWVHLPERYGDWRGVYNRLRMWAVDGTWERVFTALVAQADVDEDLLVRTLIQPYFRDRALTSGGRLPPCWTARSMTSSEAYRIAMALRGFRPSTA